MVARRPFLVAALALAACNHSRGGDSSANADTPLPSSEFARQIPLGAPPGQVVSPASRVMNPLEHDPQAVVQGASLFAAMNCVYCHGSQASGLMGPALNAPVWRYGGTPVEIYNSIHDGRPQGMPAWRDRLTSTQIWQLVAYIESLGGAAPPATPHIAIPAQQARTSTTGPQPPGQSRTDSADAGQRAPSWPRGDK